MKFTKSNLLIGGVFVATLSATPSTVNAQTAERQSRYSLDEIVVTARRVEEGLQQAPLAVTALSGVELENRGALDVVDFADVAPNVSFKTDGTTSGFGAAPRVSIRGVGQSDFVINTDPAVGIYADGVYLGRSLGSILDLMDVERVEALRGPQGTLFGRNSTGGAINVIAKTPEVGGDFNGYINGAAGEGGYFLLRGSASIPLGDTAAIRLNAMKRVRNGFIPALQYNDLDLGAEDVGGIRGALRWEIADQLIIDLDADYSTRSDSAAPFIPVLIGDLGANESDLDISGAGPQQRGVSTSVFARRYNGEGFAPGLSPNVAALGVVSTDAMCSDPTYRDANLTCLGQAWASSRDGSNQGWFDSDGNLIAPDDQSLDAHGFSGRVTWEGEKYTIKSISAFRGFKSSFLNGSPASIYMATNSNDEFEQDQFSQEITLSTSLSDRIDLLAGVFYQEEHGVEVVTTIFPLAPPAGNNDPAFLPINGIEDRNIDNSSQAIFGQISFDLTDKLELTGGARYTKEKKNVLINKIEDTAGVISTVLEGTKEISEPNFLLNLSYQANDGIMLYGQFSNGFRNGGFPARTPPGSGLNFDDVSYGPEFVDSFEIGAKTSFLDNALRLNAALFIADYTDQQINGTVVDPESNGTVSTIQNVGASKIQGIEIEANWLIKDNFRIDMSLGYLNTKLKEIDSADGLLVLNDGTNLRKAVSADDDIELPFAPELQLNIGGNYSFYLNNGAELRNRLDVIYESEQYSSIANYDFGRLPSSTRVNYLLTYVPDAPWEIGAGVRNLFDEDIVTNASFNTGPGAAGSHVISRGREAYAQFTYNFGN